MQSQEEGILGSKDSDKVFLIGGETEGEELLIGWVRILGVVLIEIETDVDGLIYLLLVVELDISLFAGGGEVEPSL